MLSLEDGAEDAGALVSLVEQGRVTKPNHSPLQKAGGFSSVVVDTNLPAGAADSEVVVELLRVGVGGEIELRQLCFY